MMVMMRAMMMAMTAVSVMPLAATRFTIARFCGHAPEAMTAPSAFLALLAAVFCPPATSTLRKLPSILFPFAALPIGTLSDAASALVFPAKIAHHNPGPVLHISLLRRAGITGVPRRRRLGRELLDEREDVVGLLAGFLYKFVIPFVIELFLCRGWMGRRIVVGI